ncbi:MAG: sensor histidine kinase [Planctomycetota bacterium]
MSEGSRHRFLGGFAICLCLMPLLGASAASIEMWSLTGGGFISLGLWLGAMAPLFLLPMLLTRSSAGAPAGTSLVRHDVDNRTAVLAAGMAHELGQPLSVARVSIEGLHMLRQLGRDPSGDYLDRVLRDVGRSVLTMSAIVDHLQTLALQTRQVARVRLDLIAFTRELLGERQLWLRQSAVPVRWQPEPPAADLVLVEEAGLRLILVNLIKNAVEAVAQLPEAQRQVVISGLGRGVLTIANRGTAIPPERLRQLFDPFVSSKEDGRSRVRGVGLYLARMAAERMGASLQVQSCPERGTVFTLACRTDDADGRP